MTTNPTHRPTALKGLIDNGNLTAEEMLQGLAAVISRNLQVRGENPHVKTDELAGQIRHVLWFHKTVMELNVKGGTMPGAFTTQLLCLLEEANPADKIRLTMAFPVYGFLMQHASQHGCWTLQRAVGAV